MLADKFVINGGKRREVVEQPPFCRVSIRIKICYSCLHNDLSMLTSVTGSRPANYRVSELFEVDLVCLSLTGGITGRQPYCLESPILAAPEYRAFDAL